MFRYFHFFVSSRRRHTRWPRDWSSDVCSSDLLNVYLKEELDKREREYRLGTVFTTANRNWEFIKARTVSQIHVSRSVAIDMESATIATNGYRYRVPFATLLCVSDKPLHGKPKLSDTAQTF